MVRGLLFVGQIFTNDPTIRMAGSFCVEPRAINSRSVQDPASYRNAASLPEVFFSGVKSANEIWQIGTQVMRDGDIHSNKKEIQYIQCMSCYGALDELLKNQTIDTDLRHECHAVKK